MASVYLRLRAGCFWVCKGQPARPAGRAARGEAESASARRSQAARPAGRDFLRIPSYHLGYSDAMFSARLNGAASRLLSLFCPAASPARCCSHACLSFPSLFSLRRRRDESWQSPVNFITIFMPIVAFSLRCPSLIEGEMLQLPCHLVILGRIFLYFRMLVSYRSWWT